MHSLMSFDKCISSLATTEIKTSNMAISPRSSLVLLHRRPLPQPPPPAATEPFSAPTDLLCPRVRVSDVTRMQPFVSGWVLSLSGMHLRLIPVATWVGSFLFIAE